MEQPPKHSLAQSTPQAKKQKVASVDQAAYYLPSKDGPIAGALLMQWLYQTIWPKLQPHTSVPYTFYSIDPIIDSSTGVNKVVGQVRTIRINGGVDWLRTAGRLAKYIPGFCRNYRVEFPLAIIHPGQNSTYLEIIAMEGDEGKTERLYGIIYADDVKLFYDYGFDPFKEPSYAKIDGKLKSIKNGTGSTDIEIANCLSARMKGQDAPVPRLAEHKYFLDFLNTLLFGLEASRNNMCFGTNLMLLHLIKDGQMTLEQAFNEGNSGQGRYPMACIKPGMGNLRMHGEICTGMTAADSAMSKCFGDPHFYAVSLKTMRLIIAWLNLIGGEGYWTDMTRQEVEGAAKRLFVKLLEPYGQ